MSELSREEALYACMFKIMLWWRAKDVNGNEWDEAIAEGKRFSANLPPEIRTALAGGGGGEKVTDGTFGDIVRPEWIDVPFKTEPDRPILLASAAEHLRAYAVSSERSAAWNARERASLESRLAAAEKRAEEACREREAFYERVMELTCERDALARKLKEAEGSVKLRCQWGESLDGRDHCVLPRGHTCDHLCHRDAENRKKLAKIREAAGE